MLRSSIRSFFINTFTCMGRRCNTEVTVNEAFDDSTIRNGLTISGGNQDAFIYCRRTR